MCWIAEKKNCTVGYEWASKLCITQAPIFLINDCCILVIAVAFNMYDLEGNNKITQAELLAVLHMMVGANISEEQVRCICNNNIFDCK